MKDYRPAKKRAAVSVGESVRILRELQEMSQNQLAEASGIPQATISAIENDRVRLGVERAIRNERLVADEAVVLGVECVLRDADRAEVADHLQIRPPGGVGIDLPLHVLVLDEEPEGAAAQPQAGDRARRVESGAREEALDGFIQTLREFADNQDWRFEAHLA